MFVLNCNKCKGSVTYSYVKSIDHYRKDNKSNKIETLDITLRDYLVYVCSDCSLEYRYSFKELEEMGRERVAKAAAGDSKEIKTLTMPRTGDKVPCGLCSGIDGKGTCFIDIYLKCHKRVRVEGFGKK